MFLVRDYTNIFLSKKCNWFSSNFAYLIIVFRALVEQHYKEVITQMFSAGGLNYPSTVISAIVLDYPHVKDFSNLNPWYSFYWKWYSCFTIYSNHTALAPLSREKFWRQQALRHMPYGKKMIISYLVLPVVTGEPTCQKFTGVFYYPEIYFIFIYTRNLKYPEWSQGF